jgi:hypothetical protein
MPRNAEFEDRVKKICIALCRRLEVPESQYRTFVHDARDALIKKELESVLKDENLLNEQVKDEALGTTRYSHFTPIVA